MRFHRLTVNLGTCIFMMEKEIFLSLSVSKMVAKKLKTNTQKCFELERPIKLRNKKYLTNLKREIHKILETSKYKELRAQNNMTP